MRLKVYMKYNDFSVLWFTNCIRKNFKQIKRKRLNLDLLLLVTK